jgi:hypothetical protein
MGFFDSISIKDLENLQEVSETLLLDKYPFHGFLLYSEIDENVAEFVRLKGQWLHSLSGKDCLIFVFENPGNWGEDWKQYWQKKLGSSFEEVSRDWLQMKPVDRNTAFELAERLNIPKNTLPCIVFSEPSLLTGDDLLESLSPLANPKEKILSIPLVTNNDDYSKYFLDVFSAVNSAAKSPPGERIKVLQVEWSKVWRKWFLPEEIKGKAKSIQEWGSLLAEIKGTLIEVINPFTPLIQQISSLLKG